MCQLKTKVNSSFDMRMTIPLLISGPMKFALLKARDMIRLIAPFPQTCIIV